MLPARIEAALRKYRFMLSCCLQSNIAAPSLQLFYMFPANMSFYVSRPSTCDPPKAFHLAFHLTCVYRVFYAAYAFLAQWCPPDLLIPALPAHGP